MILPHRLRTALVRWLAGPMESAQCDCGTWFYRKPAPHPDLKCDACRDTDMARWIAQFRASVG